MLFNVLVNCHSKWYHHQLDGTLAPFESDPDLLLGCGLGLVFGGDQKKDDNPDIDMAITVVDQRALCREYRNGDGGNELVISCNRHNMIIATMENGSNDMEVTEAAHTPLVMARKLAEIGAKEGRIMAVRFLGHYKDGYGRFHGLVWI